MALKFDCLPSLFRRWLSCLKSMALCWDSVHISANPFPFISLPKSRQPTLHSISACGHGRGLRGRLISILRILPAVVNVPRLAAQFHDDDGYNVARLLWSAFHAPKSTSQQWCLSTSISSLPPYPPHPFPLKRFLHFLHFPKAASSNCDILAKLGDCDGNDVLPDPAPCHRSLQPCTQPSGHYMQHQFQLGP